MEMTVDEVAAERVRKYYELVDKEDFDGLVALFAADATYRRPGYPPIVGRRELTRFYRNERVIDQGAHTITKLLLADRAVAVQGRFEGVLRNGADTSLEFADFFVLNSESLFQLRDTYFFTPLV